MTNLNKKHAYLIIAHNEFDMLKLLIKSLDDKRNDIYVHVDMKAKAFNQENFDGITKHSKLYFSERKSIYWAAFSLTEAYLRVMSDACKNNYEYYHVISGVDIPLKTQDFIHTFFEKEGKDKEFISVSSKSISQRIADYKKSSCFKQRIIDLFKIKGFDGCSRYFFHQKAMGVSRAGVVGKLSWLLGRFFVITQKLFGVVRNKNIDIRNGSGWYSVTNNLLKEIIDHQEFIRKTFEYTACSDEHFVQTILQSSKFKDNVSLLGNLRYIDWNRGDPYTFQDKDYDELTSVAENYLFARKFSASLDKEIVRKMYYRLLPHNVVDEILGG